MALPKRLGRVGNETFPTTQTYDGNSLSQNGDGLLPTLTDAHVDFLLSFCGRVGRARVQRLRRYPEPVPAARHPLKKCCHEFKEGSEPEGRARDCSTAESQRSTLPFRDRVLPHTLKLPLSAPCQDLYTTVVAVTMCLGIATQSLA